MKPCYLKVLSAVMYFIASISLLCFFGTDFIDSITHLDKLIAVFIFFVSMATGTRLLCVGRDFRFCRWAVFLSVFGMLAVYLVTLIDFTLIDDTFGRSISSIFTCGSERLTEHIKNDVNFIPFKTVMIFVNGYRNNLLSAHTIAENLIGNFCIFMPFALFVPMCFKRINSAIKMFAAVSVFIIIIELLQFVFITGSADIDDYILNSAGCMAAYGIFRINTVDRALNKLSYGMWRNRE